MKITSLDKLKVSHSKSLVLLICTAVLWSLAGLLIKSIGWNALAIAGTRSAIAALLILAILKRPTLPRSFSQIIGTLAYAGTVIMFVSANKLTTAANAILLQYTAPVYVAILGAVFLKEKVKKSDIVSIVLVLGGMVLFFLDDLKPGNLLGDILSLLSGVSFAVEIICLRSQKAANPLETIFWGNVLTAVIGIPFMFGSTPDTKSWLFLILLGFFQLGLSYILYSIAIKNVNALEAVLVPVIEPILNPIFVLVIVGEVPGKWSIIGGSVVLLSITLTCVMAVIRRSRHKMTGLNEKGDTLQGEV